MSVFLNNLDDFIAPSQACVNPFVIARNNNESQSASVAPLPETLASPTHIGSNIKSSAPNGIKISLQMDHSIAGEFEAPVVRPNLINMKQSSTGDIKVATVSLNDCLACR